MCPVVEREHPECSLLTEWRAGPEKANKIVLPELGILPPAQESFFVYFFLLLPRMSFHPFLPALFILSASFCLSHRLAVSTVLLSSDILFSLHPPTRSPLNSSQIQVCVGYCKINQATPLNTPPSCFPPGSLISRFPPLAHLLKGSSALCFHTLSIGLP